ncbi:F-box protein At3g54460 isoform X1 [Pyrus x bretschneideri]|uniref:F-box protein At3g54460 isoform X1 n=1 Tax=Pyrus x bretschneideri TaxID=225117 RepID=UPI00202F677A|nr:F-box protein At3g54460 isoform X1 [Pyrus x bretschneideri]
MDDDTSSFSDHKLCGFLCAVLTVTSSPDPRQTPPFGTRFRISQSDVNFTSPNGVVLSPVDSIPSADVIPVQDSKQCEVPVRELGRKRRNPEAGLKNVGIRRSRRSIGLVHGSISVVHQLHALVVNKCLMIDARLVRVEAGVSGEVRAVVLIDVYLPIALLAGWQFPRSGSIAGALFRHLSSDWGERSAMLNSGDYLENTLEANRSMWNLSDCHVFVCKLHHNFMDTSKKRLFELHEIFKSLPSVAKTGKAGSSRIQSCDDSCRSGICEISDDILLNILAALNPTDLVRVSATCCHLRLLAVSIMPCMKLKLFPHQQAAVEWMLQRERNADILPHPLYSSFSTEDGFSFYINTISGKIDTGVAPTVNDFHGGMFCDEPGLGKTITALSLILKTQGALANPPDRVHVNWCTHNGDPRSGYYELNGDYVADRRMLMEKRDSGQNSQNYIWDSKYQRSKRARLVLHDEKITGFNNSCPGPYGKGMETPAAAYSDPAVGGVRSTRSLSSISKNLFPTFEGASSNASKCTRKRRPRKVKADKYDYKDSWVQCDACCKWRKLPASIADASEAWFCSMNADPFYQSCSVPEEAWDNCLPITHLLGFCTKGTIGGEEQNVRFFVSVLKEHYALINSIAKKSLIWLTNLSPDKLSAMETNGLRSPFMITCVAPGEDAHGFQKIFQAFGLKRRVEKGVSRWFYPRNLDSMSFDVAALKIALCSPLDSVRLYLSRATLIVVPSNLVDHWNTQIQKHVRPGQLRVYVWNDHRKPSAHSLAWDYDVVITTFNRLSAEWGPRKKSAMMQVHWLRVMLDEGHTLGSSLSLTNKMQMAVSLMASNRWILTGTPTPNTPNSQLSHLQPLLKFLHEEAYGQNHKSWEAGILRPFEAKMEEGRSRLLHLLHRCMISARKVDLLAIPPCIKKVTYLDFTEEHARSYNELVVTVQRNILMADWNDPSHVESLLNPKQWKFRSATIGNVRLSCCVAGHIKVTEAGEDIQETMDILVENGLDPMSEEYAYIKYYLVYGGNCVRCKEWCRLPVITPCRHLLCLDCVALDSERCTFPGCGNLYEMQTPDELARPENPNPKWPVPKDLIELQPSYKQDNWDPDWQSTSSSKVAYIVEKLKALQEANSKFFCPPDYNDNSLHTENLLSEISDSKGSMQIHDFKMSTKTQDTNLEKVLVFSQFLEHIHVIEQQLAIAGIKYAGMYSPLHASNKLKSLAMFQHDPSCTVLLMDGSAALGLDLSFVTHVFLMEPIWDRSMEEQVVSRAHRMGATRPIHVETLAMRGTIEEQMLEFLQDADECRRFLKEEAGKSEPIGARTQRSLHDFAESNYLSHLSFVRTNSKM